MTLRPIIFFAVLAAAAAPAPAAETVSVPAFRSVQLRGGGSVVLRRGSAQRVTIVQGSTAYTRFHVTPEGQLRIYMCRTRCPRPYNLKIEIQSPSVPGLAISGGGRITADAGFPPQRAIGAAVHRGGQIDTRAVAAREVQAALSGGGQILVWAEQTLDAAVSNGGHIGYRGRPAVRTAVQGGGLVAQDR
jgi:hypothetical protein